MPSVNSVLQAITGRSDRQDSLKCQTELQSSQIIHFHGTHRKDGVVRATLGTVCGLASQSKNGCIRAVEDPDIRIGSNLIQVCFPVFRMYFVVYSQTGWRGAMFGFLWIRHWICVSQCLTIHPFYHCNGRSKSTYYKPSHPCYKALHAAAWINT